MLDNLYVIAAIVVAVVAVLRLFLKRRGGKSTTTIQKARVSGQGNTVRQNAESHSEDN